MSVPRFFPPAPAGDRDDGRDAVRVRLDAVLSDLRRAAVRWPPQALDRPGRGLTGVRVALRLSRELPISLDPDDPSTDGPSLLLALRLAETAAEYLDGAADGHGLPRFTRPSHGGG